MQARKLDYGNAADMKLVKIFFASKTGDANCNGMPVQLSMWHK